MAIFFRKTYALLTMVNGIPSKSVVLKNRHFVIHVVEETRLKELAEREQDHPPGSACLYLAQYQIDLEGKLHLLHEPRHGALQDLVLNTKRVYFADESRLRAFSS